MNGSLSSYGVTSDSFDHVHLQRNCCTIYTGLDPFTLLDSSLDSLQLLMLQIALKMGKAAEDYMDWKKNNLSEVIHNHSSDIPVVSLDDNCNIQCTM